jgi:hypothetical protein
MDRYIPLQEYRIDFLRSHTKEEEAVLREKWDKYYEDKIENE